MTNMQIIVSMFLATMFPTLAAILGILLNQNALTSVRAEVSQVRNKMGQIRTEMGQIHVELTGVRERLSHMEAKAS